MFAVHEYVIYLSILFIEDLYFDLINFIVEVHFHKDTAK